MPNTIGVSPLFSDRVNGRKTRFAIPLRDPKCDREWTLTETRNLELLEAVAFIHASGLRNRVTSLLHYFENRKVHHLFRQHPLSPQQMIWFDRLLPIFRVLE